jgi:polyhydroxyalkanoate synthesis regulator phasin
MAVEAVHNYVHLVSGFTRMTRTKAAEAAKSLLAQAGLEDMAADAGGRMTKLADELRNASRANRDLLEKLVRTEVDKATSRLGFVRAQDLEDLRREIAELRSTVSTRADNGAPGVRRVSPATEPPLSTAPGRRAAAKKSAAKKAAAKKTVAEEIAADQGNRDGAANE